MIARNIGAGLMIASLAGCGGILQSAEDSYLESTSSHQKLSAKFTDLSINHLCKRITREEWIERFGRDRSMVESLAVICREGAVYNLPVRPAE